MTPAVIGGLFGLGTAGMSSLAGLGTSALNYKYQEKMARLQNELNLESWKIMQDYNTPANQVQRLVDAGLSPNLAYGTVSTGNVSSGPQFVAPRRESPDFQTVISNALSAVNLSAQNRLLSAQAKKVELDNIDKEAQQEGYGSIDATRTDDDGTVHRYTGLSGYYAYVKELQYLQARKNLTLTDWKILLSQSQEAIADINSQIAAATKDDREVLIQKSAQLKATTAALQDIILENQQYLQDFNQQSPIARFAIMLLQSITNILK